MSVCIKRKKTDKSEVFLKLGWVYRTFTIYFHQEKLIIFLTNGFVFMLINTYQYILYFYSKSTWKRREFYLWIVIECIVKQSYLCEKMSFSYSLDKEWIIIDCIRLSFEWINMFNHFPYDGEFFNTFSFD